MRGISFDKPILFLHSSLRFFAENERHVTRVCNDDVLLMVFDGILRFAENGVEYEIFPGEYHIQKSRSFQEGKTPSDSPKYLYVHFRADWDFDKPDLPYKGTFDCQSFKPLMKELDLLSHSESSLLQKSARFFEILLMLQKKEKAPSLANNISEYIKNENLNELSLEKICQSFNFSKNHIINIFKKQFGVTPVKYINTLKLERAKYLLESTSMPIEQIAADSGFNDYAYFYKLFLRENKLSPTHWRKKKQKEPLFVSE